MESYSRIRFENLMILICSFECTNVLLARWLSWLERRPVTAEVVGSNPIRVVLTKYAGVAELADARDLKSRCSNTVPVRFRSPAANLRSYKHRIYGICSSFVFLRKCVYVCVQPILCVFHRTLFIVFASPSLEVTFLK